ncbi:MAG: hypothetical protein EOO41_05275, partial [Methanobacteriota archaeon]
AALGDALRDGIRTSLDRGALLGYPLSAVRVRFNAEATVINNDTTPAAVRACVAKCFADALRAAGQELLEPVMAVEIVLPEGNVGDILSDLTAHRRAKIKEVASSMPPGGGSGASGSAGGSGTPHAKMIVHADVPLREMVGYSTALRSRTAGEGTFTMEFDHYAHVGASLQSQLVADPTLG